MKVKEEVMEIIENEKVEGVEVVVGFDDEIPGIEEKMLKKEKKKKKKSNVQEVNKRD